MLSLPVMHTRHTSRNRQCRNTFTSLRTSCVRVSVNMQTTVYLLSNAGSSQQHILSYSLIRLSFAFQQLLFPISRKIVTDQCCCCCCCCCYFYPRICPGYIPYKSESGSIRFVTLQFTKCSPHTVIDVVLRFYILLMMFTFQFHSYVCFCVLRGK